MARDRKALGLEKRKAILGAEQVANTLRNTDAYSQPFQDLINEYVWGVAWTDPALDPKYRSILTLGVLAAKGRFTEFETHFRTALRNGLTPEELRAALIHVAIYCGVPVGVECFRVARKVLASDSGEGGEAKAGAAEGKAAGDTAVRPASARRSR